MAITCSKNFNPLQKPQPPESETFGSHLPFKAQCISITRYNIYDDPGSVKTEISPSKGICSKNFNLLKKTLTSSSIYNLWLESRIKACHLYTHQKIPHPCKFSEDKTSYNLEMVIKVHLLQKLLPAPKPLTSARI